MLHQKSRLADLGLAVQRAICFSQPFGVVATVVRPARQRAFRGCKRFDEVIALAVERCEWFASRTVSDGRARRLPRTAA